MDGRMKLTKTNIAAIRPLEGKQLLVWDTEIRGFGLRVSPGGAKSFIMQRRIGKTTRRVTIGRADDMAAEKARRKAVQLAGDFAEGIDPVKEKARTEARAINLQQAFDAYKKAPKKKGAGRGSPKKARTVLDIEKAEKRFDGWMSKPVAEITGTMVKKRHEEIAKGSPAQANLAMRYLRAAINHVIADTDVDDDPIIKHNPVDRLNRVNQWAETKRASRHIPDDKIAAWVEAVRTNLDGLKNDSEIRDALLFILLTGARLSEVLGDAEVGYEPLRWADVDLKTKVVTFRDTKNRADHELPLPSQLAALLEKRRKIAGNTYVFSSKKSAVPRNLRTAYTRIEKATSLFVTAHDLRRTFASVASKLDISTYKLKKLTNHVSGGDVTAGYITTTTEDLRDAIQRVEDYMLSAERRPDDETNVVKLEATA